MFRFPYLCAIAPTIGLAFMVTHPTENIESIGHLLVLIGAVFICTNRVCTKLDAVNRPADEAWHEGYEAGFDKGWREGNATPRTWLHVINGGKEDAEDGLGGEVAERPLSG